jgi:glutamyl-tRNA(Gln) amidotransferase subunit D
MKSIKFLWRNKQYEGYLINENNQEYEIKFKNGYNVIIPINEIQILEEKEIIRQETKISTKGDIAIIATGGTIMSKVDYRTGAVYPSLDLIENIQADIILPDKLKFSEDMLPEDWGDIAKLIYDQLRKDKPVIVLHGTDTMTYTSSAVAFAIRDINKPVVFVGSQRSSDRPSSDYYLNITGAYEAIKSDIGEIMICMHKDLSSVGLFRAVRTRKNHTSRRDAFKGELIAKIPFEILDEYKKISELGTLKNNFSRDVALVYFYPGMKSEQLEYFSNYKGLVIVGTGMGHINSGLIETVKQLREKMPIAITSQTIYGRINMNVYSNGRDLLKTGVLGNYLDILPEVAYVKMSWIVGNKLDEKIYEENIVKEFSYSSLA